MPIPPKPPALQVTSVTHQSLDLSWETLHAKLAAVMPADEGRLKAEVQVQRLDQAGDSSWDTAYKGFDTKCSITGLSDSQAYGLRFRFGVASGWGDFSAPQSVKTSRRPFSGEDLHRLVRLEKEAELRRVLDTGEANVNAPDDKGFSPLMQAALAGNVAFCEILLDHGAEVDWCAENGKTALMLVSYRGVLPSVRLLLERGASRQHRDRKGSTALHYAVDGEKLDAIGLLLTTAADASEQQQLLHARDASGCSAIVRCAMLKNNGNPDVARALLQAGARPDDADDQRQTALFYCALQRHLRMAEAMLEAGADANLANDKGVTPLAVAEGQESAALRLAMARYAKMKEEAGLPPPPQ